MCIDKAPGESRRFGTCKCEQMDVVGTCECGHDAKSHANIDARFAHDTHCTEVFTTESVAGLKPISMACTCTAYIPRKMVSV